MVLREAYWMLFHMAIEYGYENTLFMASFLLSIPVFLASAVGTFVCRYARSYLKNAPVYFVSFFITLFYFLILAYVDFPSEPALFNSVLIVGLLLYFVFILPFGFVYGKILGRWEVLPWHFVQYCMVLIASLVFWAVLIYYFKIFELGMMI
jgi:hypothetical protein